VFLGISFLFKLLNELLSIFVPELHSMLHIISSNIQFCDILNNKIYIVYYNSNEIIYFLVIPDKLARASSRDGDRISIVEPHQ